MDSIIKVVKFKNLVLPFLTFMVDITFGKILYIRNESQ